MRLNSFMILSSKSFWIIIFSLAVTVSGLVILLNKLGSANSVNSQEQHPKQGNQDKTVIVDKRTQQKQVNATDEKLKSDAQGVFSDMIEESVMDISREFSKSLSESPRKSDTTKIEFDDLFNNQDRIETGKILKLIRKSDRDSRDWFRDQLTERFNSDPNPRNRIACMICLTMFPEVSRDIYLKALSDSDRSVRQRAASGLGQKGTEQDVDVLFQALKDDDGFQREGRTIAKAAMSSLGEIGGKRATGVLVEVWKDEELSKGCKVEAITGLGMTGHVDSLDVLENVLKGNDESIRNHAVRGIGRVAWKNLEDPKVANRAISLLRNSINDKNPNVRVQVARALGKVGNSDDVKLLEGLLNDSHSRMYKNTRNGVLKEKLIYPVREKAREAINEIESRLALQK